MSLTETSKGVGQPLRRADGRLKVTGQARYAAEAPMQNSAFAWLVSSTIAKGRVTEIDAGPAESAPGVLAVITPKNMPKLQPRGFMGDSRIPLSDMNVQYAGQYVAVVVADTPERARHAASLLKITYAADAPVGDIHDERAAKKGGAPESKRGDVEAAMKAEGLTVVHETYVTPIETHNPMEMSATTAIWEGPDRLTVWSATQGVMGTRDVLASAFGLDPENVRVLCPYVGGGFGCKGAVWPHTLLAAVAAKMAKRPVRLVLTRPQMFVGCGHRPNTEQEMTLAADKDGKLVALRHETRTHGSPTGNHVEACGQGTSRLMYAVPNALIRHTVNSVDLAPATFMRAPGECPGTYALESAMDELAVALGMDPVALRLANYADKHPDSGLEWSTHHVKECYAVGAERFGWSKRNPKPGSMRSKDGRPMGWGMATATYPAHRFPSTARIRLMLDAKGVVRAVGAAATQDLGTGTWTIGAQMTATLVGLPVEQVKFELGDSDLPAAGVSGGSATAGSIALALGGAVGPLCAALLEIANADAGSPLAGLKPEEVTLKDGRLIAATDPQRNVELAALLKKSGKPYVEGVTLPGTRLQAVPGAEDYGANQRKYAFQSFGAHFVEVVIDDPVPLVRVTRVVSVMDVGRVVNPKTAHSQVIGGVVMGVGMALMEHTAYDPRTVRPVNDNFADYAVPVNPDIHTLEAYFIDEPDLHFNPIGCRGVGEIGITGVTAAIANAVFHATGKRIRELPITPDKLL